MLELLLLLFEDLEGVTVFSLFELVAVEPGLSFFDSEELDLLEESVFEVSSFFSSWPDALSGV